MQGAGLEIDAIDRLEGYKDTRLYALAREARRRLKDSLRQIRDVDRRVATLEPEGAARGDVLLAYVVAGFYERPDSGLLRSHTHYRESMEIARAWREAGFRVDVIDNYNVDFRPARRYDVVIGARMILEAMGNATAKEAGRSFLKVLHIDTAHWLFHNRAQYARLAALAERRGMSLRPRQLVEPNGAIEYADCAITVGNEFTAGTYAHAGTPVRRVPISTVWEAPWPADKDFTACRHRFMWFGGKSVVHKGLDLVLEAFAGMPDLELVVCGPLAAETDFCRAYHQELFETPNIRVEGWVDVGSRRFEEIARGAVAVVKPSASESGCGAVITCMHAGIIPVVTHEASVDVEPDFGVLLPGASIDTIRRGVRELEQTEPERLREMSRCAWEFARRRHTRAGFAREYRAALGEMLEARDALREGAEGARAGTWQPAAAAGFTPPEATPAPAGPAVEVTGGPKRPAARWTRRRHSARAGRARAAGDQ